MILSFVIPTNKPDVLRQKFYSCLPAFEPIKEHIEFCLNCQPPYTDDDIRLIKDELSQRGFNIKIVLNTYNFTKESFAYIKLRNDAARLATPGTLCFVDFDDDIYYDEINIPDAQKCWIYAIIYMLEHPKCGSFRIDSRYSGCSKLNYNRIYPCLSDRSCGTGLGLIYRNIYHDRILPSFILDLKGGNEDVIEIYQRCLDGYSTAFLLNPFGHHVEVKREEVRIKYDTAHITEPVEGTIRKYKLDNFDRILDTSPYPTHYCYAWEDVSTKVDMMVDIQELQSRLNRLIGEEYAKTDSPK